MSDALPGSSPGTGGRDGRTAAFALCCLLAVLLAAGTLPALSSPLGADDRPGEVGPVSSAVGAAMEDVLGGQVVGAGVADQLRMDGIDRYNDPGNHVVFTVEADRPAYWRVTSYDAYDHDGWIRSSDVESPGLVPSRVGGETLRQQVTFRTRMDVVPAAYRGSIVGGDRNASRDSGDGLRLEGSAQPGDVVFVESVLPVTDAATLEAHDDWDYPSEVEARYTALPDDVPDRVHERTDEITAGAEDPHEVAVAVERWLRENRNYSLRVTPPEGDVADEMLFERQEGHCVYFAATMVVMLRSEGVPARFVTGYTPGEASGGEFTVRERNAHAWVEVYYPGLGWVPFDPTPPDDRAAAIDAGTAADVEPPVYDPAARDTPRPVTNATGPADDAENGTDPSAPDTATDPDAPDDGTDGEPTGNETAPDDGTDPQEPDDTADPDDGAGGSGDGDGTDDGPDDGTDDGADDDPGPRRTIELESDPVPGQPLVVTVTEDGEPASGLVVAFNGDPVGTTDERGRVGGEVPFADRLEVAVVEDAGDGQSASVAGPGKASSTAGVDRHQDESERGAPGDDAVTVALPTEVDVEVLDDPLAGEPVEVVATIDGAPVPFAGVAVDGRGVGTTDGDGHAVVELPDRGNATIRVERGAASGERTVDALDVELSVERGSFVLPYRSTTVLAEADGEPVAGVPVLLDGERVATTGGNGTATVSPPPSVTATVALGGDGQLAETTVLPVPALLGLLALVGTGIGCLGAVAVAADRDRLPAPGPLAGAVAGRLVAGLVATSRAVDDLLAGGEDSRGRLGAVGRSVRRRIVGLLDRSRRLPGVVAGRIAGALAGVRGGPGGAAGGRRAARGTVAWSEVGGSVPDDGSLTPAALVLQSWHALVDALPVRNPETRTPAELAERAVEAGFPEHAVERTLEAFRAIAYADREPAPEEAERIHAALDGTATGSERWTTDGGDD